MNEKHINRKNQKTAKIDGGRILVTFSNFFIKNSKMSGKSTAQIDAKREEFRKYLEKEGVLESLTKALVKHRSKFFESIL